MQVDLAGKGLPGRPESCLQTYRTISGVFELAFLVFDIHRGMIGSNTADRAFFHTFYQRCKMFFRPQRREYFVPRIEIPKVFVVQQQMVRGHTTRNIHAFLLRLAYHPHGTRGRHAGDMQRGLGVFGQENIPRHGDVLGDVRDTVQAERSAHYPFVGHPTVHHLPVYGGGHRQGAERAVVFEYELFDQVVCDLPAVPECYGAALHHVIGFGHRLSFAGFGRRPYGMDVDGELGFFFNEEFHFLPAVRRAAAGRSERHGRKSAARGGTAPAFQRFRLFVKGFAEPAGRIHPARRHTKSFFIDDVVSFPLRGDIVGYFPDRGPGNENIFCLSVEFAGRVYD